LFSSSAQYFLQLLVSHAQRMLSSDRQRLFSLLFWDGQPACDFPLQRLMLHVLLFSLLPLSGDQSALRLWLSGDLGTSVLLRLSMLNVLLFSYPMLGDVQPFSSRKLLGDRQ
jgi:hypothetical protein